MPETNSSIILNLISEALGPIRYKIKPTYYPFVRRIKPYKLDLADFACDMNLKTIKNKNLSGVYLGEASTYENFAFALREKNINSSISMS